MADLAGRTLPVLPAEALITSRANSPWHRTAWCLAAEFVHDLAPSEGPLLLGLMISSLSGSKYSTFSRAVLQKIRGEYDGREVLPFVQLRRLPKQAGDERRLPRYLLFDATLLAFPYHVHHLISLQGSPCRLE